MQDTPSVAIISHISSVTHLSSFLPIVSPLRGFVFFVQGNLFVVKQDRSNYGSSNIFSGVQHCTYLYLKHATEPVIGPSCSCSCNRNRIGSRSCSGCTIRAARYKGRQPSRERASELALFYRKGLIALPITDNATINDLREVGSGTRMGMDTGTGLGTGTTGLGLGLGLRLGLRLGTAAGKGKGRRTGRGMEIGTWSRMGMRMTMSTGMGMRIWE